MTRLATWTLVAILALAAPAGAASHETAEGEPAAGKSMDEEAMGEGSMEGDPMGEEPMGEESMGDAEAMGEEAAPAEEPAGPPPEVARAQFTTAVVEREPTDAVTRLENDVREVTFFAELRNFEGERVLHRWKHGGEVRAEVAFAVEGPRWRVHSTKALLPGWTGEWTVEVVDGSGEVVAEERFTYVEAEPRTEEAGEAGAAAGSGSEAMPEAGEEAMPEADEEAMPEASGEGP